MASNHDFKRFPELTNGQMDFYYFESPHKQIFEGFRAKVINVHDGDTITVRWDERDFDFPVRFNDTNAPELKDPGGKEAQSWLENRLLNEMVDIEVNPQKRVGKFGRLLGTIHHNGTNINQASINAGQARPFDLKDEWSLPDLNKIIGASKIK